MDLGDPHYHVATENCGGDLAESPRSHDIDTDVRDPSDLQLPEKPGPAAHVSKPWQ